jgi:hypothetical protein
MSCCFFLLLQTLLIPLVEAVVRELYFKGTVKGTFIKFYRLVFFGA